MLAAALGCEAPETDGSDASTNEPSPNANILPAPLASSETPAAAVAQDESLDSGLDAGPVVLEPLNTGEPPAPEAPTPLDAQGFSLQASFRWHNLSGESATGQTDQKAIEELRRETQPRVLIELSASGRMRLRFDAPSFPLPEGTELRGKRGLLGQILVWPGGRQYRVLRFGLFRALLTEGRADAMPLVVPKVTDAGEGSVANTPTKNLELETPLGRLSLARSELPSVSGSSLCQLLVALIGAQPNAAGCTEDLVPLRAEAHWADGGRLDFEVEQVTPSSELSFDQLTLRVGAATFKLGELPRRRSGPLLSETRLRRMRLAASAVEPGPNAPPRGLTVVNRERSPRLIFVDGVPAGWVQAGDRATLQALRAGQYTVQTRDFLGIFSDPPRGVSVPQRLVLGGAPDAGP